MMQNEQLWWFEICLELTLKKWSASSLTRKASKDVTTSFIFLQTSGLGWRSDMHLSTWLLVRMQMTSCDAWKVSMLGSTTMKARHAMLFGVSRIRALNRTLSDIGTVQSCMKVWTTSTNRCSSKKGTSCLFRLQPRSFANREFADLQRVQRPRLMVGSI